MARVATHIPDLDVSYWESVAREWSRDHPFAVWREHSDRVNRSLIERWLTGTHLQRLLKTDLFDEATAAGVLPALREKADWIVGVDISRTVVAMAADRGATIDLVQADVRRLPFPASTLDGVVSLSTLDHFDTEDSIVCGLTEIGRVLRSGGELFLTLDNLDNPVVRLRNALPFSWTHRLGLVPYAIGVTCGRTTLERHLRHAGFEVLETSAVMHCPRVLAVPIARYLHKHGSEQPKRWFLRFLQLFEHLESWFTRYWTGYFLAVRARKAPETPKAD